MGLVSEKRAAELKRRDERDACRQRPPIKHFVKETGEPAVQISGKPDPEGLKKFDEKASHEWRTPFTWTDSLDTPDVRTFATGATRDTEEGKNDYEGFLSPLVIEAFGDYMTRHRVQSDGNLRDSDNWQKGIPKDAYIKSAWRHLVDLWKEHRGLPSRDGIDEALGGLLFNVMGYWFQVLQERERPI